MKNNMMNVPGDYEVDQANFARRRKLLDAVAAQSQEGLQGQMVSGHYVAPHAMQYIGKLAGTVAALYGNKKVDEEETASKAQYQSGLADAMQNYQKTKFGGQETFDNQGPMQDGSAMEGSQTFDMPGDSKRAMAEALASQYKPMQQIGMQDLMSSNKQEAPLSQKDILSLSGYDAKSKLAAARAGNIDFLEGEKEKPIALNNKLVVPNGEGGFKVAGDFGDKFGDVGPVAVGPDGKPMIGQKELGSGKVAWAPGGGTTVNVDASQDKGATKFAQAAAEAGVKRIEESAAAAKKAQMSYEVFSNAASQVNQLKGGTGADLILGAKKLITALGGSVDPSVTANEQIGAALGQAVLDNSKALGTGSGFTDKDREFLEKIVMGKMTLDEASLKRAINLGLAGSLNTLRGHQKLMKTVGNVKGADPEMMSMFNVDVPSFSLDYDKDFGYDPKTDRITVRTAAGSAPTPNPATGAPTAPKTGLSPAEQKELMELRSHFKGKL